MEDSELQQLILVVDDRQDHLEIIEQVLVNGDSCSRMVSISTTSEAIDFLYRQGDHAQAQRPDIVLIDMRLTDGQAATILSTIKTDPKLRQIPTIILTPDATDDDILNSYQQQCNSFVLKPQDLSNLSRTLEIIKSFWLELVTLPI